jgi:hypothetical protein
VNCVIWKDDHLYFACDAGNLECWVPLGQFRDGKESSGMDSVGTPLMAHANNE